MMKLTYFILAINLTHGAIAKTVLYTTTNLPPNSAKDDFEVVYLDAPDKISNILVIKENSLSTNANSLRNKSRELTIIHQQKIVNAWNSVINAWELGVNKYPAVVFDDVNVVYGTTDVDLAKKILAQGGNP